MAYSTYLDLVNALRDRFNEVHLSTSNFNAVVGFDQFTKDAINYAYHDILNAEMEWPFLHQTLTMTTSPGTQLYTYGGGNVYTVKTIDWDSFYLINNNTLTIIHEVHTVSSSSPHIITPTNVASWSTDLGVLTSPIPTPLTAVIGDPATGQYTIANGTYYFNSAQAGSAMTIQYTTSTAATNQQENAIKLDYVDYNTWRSQYLTRDLNAKIFSNYSVPQCVYKTQIQAQFGVTPIPDKYYTITYEAWIDGTDMSATTDSPLFPLRFNQIILDGAQKYCYEFREDPQSAQMADSRFKAGIARMRIELINSDNTMRSGFYWPHSTITTTY